MSYDNELPVTDSTTRGLSGFHLLVWTALAAMLLGLRDLVDRLQPLWVRNIVGDWTALPIAIGLRTVQAMAGAASIGGLLLWISHRRRGVAFPVQPGEWILVMLGIAELVDLAAWYSSLLKADRTYYTSTWFSYYYFLTQCVNIVALGLILLLSTSGGAWKRFFWTAVAISVVAAGFALMPVLSPDWSYYAPLWAHIMWSVAGSAMLGTAVVSDLRRSVRRGWIHWLGVLTLIVFSLNNEIWYIYVRYLR